MDLYSDNNPKTTVKGFGFKNKEKARNTINRLKKYNKKYQKQVILTMYYRAKHHPNKTKEMKEAQKEFKKGNKELGLNLDLS